jgi:hypothetical protein
VEVIFLIAVRSPNAGNSRASTSAHRNSRTRERCFYVFGIGEDHSGREANISDSEGGLTV